MERTIRSENSMVTGVIWKQLLLFFFPIMLGSLFQQLYNTVDAIVVGKFVGTDALAAVGGSASNILNLLIGFFTGVSSGATVIISQYFGANDRDGVNRALHTAMLFALVGGAFIMVLGLVGTEFMLRLMDTPEDTIAGSALYLRIMFMGMVPNMVYNVGSAILRAMGDSKRPLYFLIVACLSNVVLDLVFVLVFKMGIAGVAIASILAQAISAVMVVMSLSAESMEYRFRFRQMRFEGGHTFPHNTHRPACRLPVHNVLPFKYADSGIRKPLRYGYGGILGSAWQSGRHKLDDTRRARHSQHDVRWPELRRGQVG